MNFSKNLLAGFAVLVLAVSGTSYAVTVGDHFPDVKVEKVDSGFMDLKAMQGKVTVLNFWATWCASCKVEILEMEEKFAGLMSNDNFNLAFVSVDKNPDEAKKWFQQNVKSPDVMGGLLFQDPKFEVAELLKLDSFPMTFVIDAAGKVKHVQRGYVEGKPSTDEIAKIVTDLLTEKN